MAELFLAGAVLRGNVNNETTSPPLLASFGNMLNSSISDVGRIIRFYSESIIKVRESGLSRVMLTCTFCYDDDLAEKNSGLKSRLGDKLGFNNGSIKLLRILKPQQTIPLFCVCAPPQVAGALRKYIMLDDSRNFYFYGRS